MVEVFPFSQVAMRGGLLGVLVLAALIRLPHIAAPLADNLQIKQVESAQDDEFECRKSQ